MPWKSKPRVPDLDDEPHFRWPAWHVGHDQEDLFVQLHERFNTVPFFIQDPESFHRDAVEITALASDQEHFYQLLQQRKEQRLQELKAAFRSIVTKLGAGYSQLSGDQRFCLIRLSRLASYDCLVKLLESLLSPDASGREPFSEKGSDTVSFFAKDNTALERRHPLPSPESTSSPDLSVERTTNMPSPRPDDPTSTQEICSQVRSSQKVTNAKRKRNQHTDDEGADSKSRNCGKRRVIEPGINDTLDGVEKTDTTALDLSRTTSTTHLNGIRGTPRTGGNVPKARCVVDSASRDLEVTTGKAPEPKLAPSVGRYIPSIAANSNQQASQRRKRGNPKRKEQSRRTLQP